MPVLPKEREIYYHIQESSRIETETETEKWGTRLIKTQHSMTGREKSAEDILK